MKKMEIDPSIQQARIDTPFGPVVFGMQLPENVFQNCAKLADDVWARKDRIDWSHELIGHMKHQYYVPHSELKEYNLYDYFMQCFYWYIENGSFGSKATKTIEEKKKYLLF